MFCHQCQETAKGTGCTVQGVCGKKEEVANLQDLFIWTLKGISVWGLRGKELAIYDEKIAFFIVKGMFSTITNANFNGADFITFIKEAVVHRQHLQAQVLQAHLVTHGTAFVEDLPECATWSFGDETDILAKATKGTGGWLEIVDEDERSLKATVQYGLKGLCAYAEHAYQLGGHKREIFEFIMEALAALVDPSQTLEELLSLVLNTGGMGVQAMALLDQVNNESYGTSEISTVSLGVGHKPGILVSGHDLKDLEELLIQTEGSGVDIYTHGEMLPAHYYPKLKKYDHLVGNYGNAWWSQRGEFDSFHGPVLFTSNCIIPPKPAHVDRIFTTGAVGVAGCAHIPDRSEGQAKDFSPIINLALSSQPPEQIEQGSIVGGFGHGQLLALKDKIIDAVKSGAIKRFVVMGGCDGRHKSRDYYTQVAQLLPRDTVILTAGCAKYKYLKLELGDIDGIPRILDAGQCNDSYSLVVIALELQEAFALKDINDLPISFDIAWYEQKAVLVLLALLSLGVKGIRLGPTLPGFFSENIASILMDHFEIKAIATPEEDVAAMLAGH